MLAFYVFSVIVLSQASEQAAQYSRVAGLLLTYVFLAEFLFTRKKSIYLPAEFGPLALFALWSIASFFWTDDPSWTFTTVKTLCQLLLFWFVSVNVMVFYGSILPTVVGLLAGLVWAIFNALKSNQFNLMQGPSDRVGSLLTNANAYAVALCLGILAALFLYRFSPSGSRWLLVPFVALAVQQIYFYSGSRKGMIGVVLTFGLYFAITSIFNGRNSPGQILLFLFGIVAAYFVGNWLISNSPFGERLFNYQEEASFVARENLIDFAIDQWKTAPLLGHGANQFRVLYEAQFGVNTYSHNNYFEILVNHGLVGIVIFYSFYVIVAVKYAKAWFERRATTPDIAWALTLIVLLVLWDFAMVSIEEKLYWIMFAQLAAHYYLLTRKQQVHSTPSSL
jgi:O-antigen ligase